MLTLLSLLFCVSAQPEVGDTNLSGSLTRQAEQTCNVDDASPHLANIGRMIEDMESDMRSNLNELYLLKTREVVNSIRSQQDGPTMGEDHVAILRDAISKHGQSRKVDSDA